VYCTIENSVGLTFNLDNIVLNSKKAVSIGLILNEAVTNSLKYAFPDYSSNSVISISMLVEKKDIILGISDNGIGVQNVDSLKFGDTLGMQLLYLLAESQLGGSIEINSSKGLEIIIRFKP
jgi:two-component system, sensor histidine kinase PdtaS